MLGCEKNDMDKEFLVPEFSAARLHEKLERLTAAFEAKGIHVSKSLLPPLPENEVRARCHWFPRELSEEIIALYGWSGGQEKDAWEEEYPFWFRDNSFSSLTRAETEYRSMMESYGSNPADHDLLKYCFPFASFNGSWFVLPTKGHPLDNRLPKPVISVLEGVDIYFYSIESMIDTCIEWVGHPSYAEDYTLLHSIELEIWRKYNPGIFEN